MAKTSIPLLRSGHVVIQKTMLWGAPAGTPRSISFILPGVTDGCRMFVIDAGPGPRVLSTGSLLKHFVLPNRQSLDVGKGQASL